MYLLDIRGLPKRRELARRCVKSGASFRWYPDRFGGDPRSDVVDVAEGAAREMPTGMRPIGNKTKITPVSIIKTQIKHGSKVLIIVRKILYGNPKPGLVTVGFLSRFQSGPPA
jgi:hypothetical protein